MRLPPAAYAIPDRRLHRRALDITYAIVFSAFHRVFGSRVLQSVAVVCSDPSLSGWLSHGRSWPAPSLLHHVLHCGIYYAVSLRWPSYPQAGWFGALLWAVVYAVMNFIRAALSATRTRSISPPASSPSNLFVHMVFIGLPISLRFASLRYAGSPVVTASASCA